MRVAVAVALFVLVSGCDWWSPEAAESGDVAEVINGYREELGLDRIPVSDALTEVAAAHVEDLAAGGAVHGDCNLHSWSDRGDWAPCCYTDDHAEAECMWSKPEEIAGYASNGYEIAAGGSGWITADEALSIWQGSDGHHAVIVNEDIWTDHTWLALGGAVQGGYAVAWFGDLEEL
jgi:hypothetical protein